MERPGHGGDVTPKTTAAQRGGSRQTKRSRWWKRERDEAVAWERSFRASRQALLQGGFQSLHSQWYCDHLEDVIHRIKFGGERWIKRMWHRLTGQYSTSRVSTMARAMRRVMTESDSSGLYQLVSFDMSRIYTGLCNERPMCERFVEHLTAINASVQPDDKYRGMKRCGGASSWYMIPMAVAGGVVPGAELRRLEAVMIRSESNSWNNFQSKKQSKSPQKSLSLERGRRRPKPKQMPEPMHLQAKVVTIAGNGKRVDERDECSLDDLVKEDRIVVHSSKLRQLTKTVRLLLRKSVVRLEVVKGRTLVTFTGTFKATLKITDRLFDSWFYLRFVHRKVTKPVRSERYQALVKNLRSDRLKEELKLFRVDALYSIWWISRRENSEERHEKVKAAVRKELRGRGIRAIPELRLVLRVPPEARISRLEVRRAVKGMLARSHLPTALVSATMWSLVIVYEKVRTIGDSLDTTKRWIPKLVTGVKCSCSEYPSDWPKRHDHLCIPTWKYSGLKNRGGCHRWSPHT